MRQFISFVKKEFYHIFRDGRTMLILLGMPVVQMLLFGFAINMDVKNVRTVIYDSTQDATTIKIGHKIDASSYFHLLGYVHSAQEIDDLLNKGKIDMAVVFENNFSQNLIHSGHAQVQIITNTSDPNSGTIATNYMTALLGDFGRELSADGAQIPYQINIESKLLYNPEMNSAYTFVPGIMGLVLMIICSIMTSISIVREKERGTMEVLLASPLKSGTILIAKIIPYLALSIINLITILLLSVYVLHVPINGSLGLMIFVSILFIFLALSLGLLISTAVSTQVAAILISGIGLLMPTLILSGMIFPINSMPVALQWFSTTVPARWYISAMKKIMIEGLGFVYVIKEIGIILGMISLFISLSIWNIKERLNY